MTTLTPTEYQEKKMAVPPFEIHIVSYRLGDRFYCSVDNVDPGAVVARGEGNAREEAEQAAIARAKERLGRTRILS